MHAGCMHIRDWPEGERPREKLLAHGAGSLSDAELLAIFLGSGTAGRDAVASARDLLAGNGGLRALLDREPQAHVYWSSHQPWLPIADDLPKKM